MATTRLSDLIVPEIYTGYQSLEGTEVTRFFDAGVAVRSPLLDERARGASQITNIPFWKDLDATSEPDVVNDNPSDKSVASKIQASSQIGYTAYLHKSWSSMDLAAAIIGEDPVTEITAKTNRYWARQFQRRLIASALGVYRDNVASNGGDMVHDASTSGSITDSNRIAVDSVNQAELTLGDAIGSTSAMCVHSQIFARLRKLDMISYVQPSADSGLMAATPQGNPMYQGKMVIVDDSMPILANGSNATYMTILFGQGAFGYGEGVPKVPVEVSRDATSGNGGGEDILHERKQWLIHPFGYRFDAGSMAGTSPTISELGLAANWSRVVDRKLVPLAFLITNI